MATAFKNIHKAIDVGFDIGVRIDDRVTNASLCGQIHRDIELVRREQASTPHQGFAQVLLAGEQQRREMRGKCVTDSIPVSETSWNEILKAAERQGVRKLEVNRLGGLCSLVWQCKN